LIQAFAIFKHAQLSNQWIEAHCAFLQLALYRTAGYEARGVKEGLLCVLKSLTSSDIESLLILTTAFDLQGCSGAM
jgi:hypothetical protein